jgi:putative transposase
MANFYLRLMSVLASASHDQLRAQIQYLRAENQILRAKLGRVVRTTPDERARLVQLAAAVGDAIKELVSIVQPCTLLKWARQAKSGVNAPAASVRKGGSRRTPDEVRALIVRMAQETGWGLTRIWGELRKLEMGVSRTTISKILKEHHIPISPKRKEPSWENFIKSHAQTLWACDFVTQPVLTWRGWVQMFFLVFMHVDTRRVVVSGVTTRPTARWAKRETKMFIEAEEARAGTADTDECGDRETVVQSTGAGAKVVVGQLIHDRDGKFGPGFDVFLQRRGVQPVRIPAFSPNLNAYAERFIRTLRNECLDQFVVMGRRHLRHLLAVYSSYYNHQRPHSALEQITPCGVREAVSLGSGVRGTVEARTKAGAGGDPEAKRRASLSVAAATLGEALGSRSVTSAAREAGSGGLPRSIAVECEVSLGGVIRSYRRAG